MSPEQQPVHRHINHFQAPIFESKFELPEIPAELNPLISNWIKQDVLRNDPGRITPGKVEELVELTYLANLRGRVDKRMAEIAIRAYEREDASWREIGTAVGLTKEGARRRWSPIAKEHPSVKARMRKNK